MRDPTYSNPNPVYLRKGFALPTSQQLTAHLLCRDCEQLINKHGESWVLRNCYRGTGKFLLRDKLINATPLFSRLGECYLGTKSIHSIDINKIVYFAASMFWRSSIHKWKDRSKAINIRLGKRYEEEFRQFLLGAANFPKNAVIAVSISTSNEPLIGVPVPHGGKLGKYYYYNCIIPGIIFDLFLGGELPEIARVGCIYHSEENVICLTDKVEQRLMQELVKSLKGTS